MAKKFSKLSACTQDRLSQPLANSGYATEKEMKVNMPTEINKQNIGVFNETYKPTT